MQSIRRNRGKIALAALAVFVLGFLAGVMALNLYMHGRIRRNGGHRDDRFMRMVEELNLTPDQKSQVDAILTDTRAQLDGVRKECEPKVVNIRNGARERLQKVLTPDQWAQLQGKLKERGWLREGGQGAHGPMPPP